MVSQVTYVSRCVDESKFIGDITCEFLDDDCSDELSSVGIVKHYLAGK